MEDAKRKVEIGPHLLLQLSVRNLSKAEVEEVADRPLMAEKLQETRFGIRYVGTGSLKNSDKRVTFEYLDTRDNRRIVLSVVTGIWNK